jgi:hypothetical protein
MKYLSKEPIVFTPARTADPVKLTKPCDHAGRKQILQGNVWRCECGEPDIAVISTKANR